MFARESAQIRNNWTKTIGRGFVCFDHNGAVLTTRFQVRTVPSLCIMVTFCLVLAYSPVANTIHYRKLYPMLPCLSIRQLYNNNTMWKFIRSFKSLYVSIGNLLSFHGPFSGGLFWFRHCVQVWFKTDTAILTLKDLRANGQRKLLEI